MNRQASYGVTVRALRDAASLAVIAIGLAACASARPAVPATPVASCVIDTKQANAADTLSLATMAAIDPTHVPEPTNSAERLVFAQVYETLIDVDCDGRARPGLAQSWTLDATRTRVTLVLRDGARFGSGQPVTSGDVLAAWRATAARSSPSAALARDIAEGTTVVDGHTLIVSLPDTAFLVLASPTLALYQQRSANEWPDGSGPYHVAIDSMDARSGALILQPSAPSSDPYLVTRRVPNGDPRDAIDAGVDVLVTGDPTAVSYAAARANLASVPLPWTRTYALAVPVAAPEIAAVLPRPDSESQVLRASLAHDAVHAVARAAQPPYWWDGATSCDTPLDSLSRSRAADGRSNRIVYRGSDGVARGLAERLVALDPRTVAAGLAPDDFARALRDGGDLAYVIDLPRAALSPCHEFAELRSAAPWLASGIEAKIVPLIDTRETAIVNRDRVSATIDWRGTLYFGGAQKQP
jgi:hypothetical protein